MKKTMLMGFIAGCLVVLAAVGANASMLGMEKTLEGTITGITSDFITISQASEEDGRMEEINIKIDDATMFEEVASLKDLHAGDQVKVLYMEEENSVNMAILVAKLSVQEEVS
ncbi:MAG: hypothetical protein KC713_08145 [Candidatus Omnitrophica bacterium]|nr:hypothetical protein [Candidatus Omnitrophota bacterium]